jgi:hypothetical protein
MVETKQTKKRKDAWRAFPCPSCGGKDFLKDFINGFPGEGMDESKHIYGGCLPEYWSRAEIACVRCGWEGSKTDLQGFAIPATKLSERFSQAFLYANTHHQNQSRKETDVAYICHPLGVASLVIEAGGDEDLAIAGLLHDVPEDCGGEIRLNEIAERFGSRVSSIVRACSDALPVAGETKAPYMTRKKEHIDHLWELKDKDVLLVTAADKLHNARAITTDLEIIGEELWLRFNGDAEDVVWYYEEMFKVFAFFEISPILLWPLSDCIRRMKEFL